MRVTRQTFETHRVAILDAAGRLFRRRGLDGVSLAEVSRAAGLTHGAFYGHYPSKKALVEASCRQSLAAGAAAWRRRADRARAEGANGLGAIVDFYLSEAHRDAPDGGCALASIGPELLRGDTAMRAALDDGVAGLLAVLEEEIARGRPALVPEAGGRVALGVLAAMAGGLVLSRCLADPGRSAAALQSARAASRAAAMAG